MGNNRIDAEECLNQCCVPAPELDSFLRDPTPKIFLQQYRPISTVATVGAARSVSGAKRTLGRIDQRHLPIAPRAAC
jgi:hypothetical protein